MKGLLRAAGWLIAAGALAGVAWAAQPMIAKLATAGAAPQPGWLAGASLGLAAAYLLTLDRWRRWLRAFDVEVGFRTGFSWTFRTVLAKYLPGGGWHFAARAALAARAGLPAAPAAIAMVLDDAANVATGSLFGVVVLSMAGLPAPAWANGLALALGLAALGLALPWLLRRVVAWARPDATLPDLGPARVGRMAIACLLGWLVQATAFVAFAQALAPSALTPTQAATLLGALPLAWALGAVAVFAPAGIGVREAGLVALLATAFPPDWAATVAVGSRVWSLAVEAVIFGVAWALPGPEGADARG